MQLGERTLQALREIINGDGTPYYKTGPELVAFFNNLGAHDRYGAGFPSRKAYTEEKLKAINGTPEIDKCIRNIFSVENYVDDIEGLDKRIALFNKHLAFAKWQVVRDNDTITFRRLEKVVIPESKSVSAEMQEEDFLKLTFKVDIDALNLDVNVSSLIKQRLREVEFCLGHEAPLASIFLIGSILEGILLGVATTFPDQFNQAQSAPRDKDGKIRKHHDWKLNSMIDVATEIGILKQDVKKFSHAVRDFRNYIHPYAQVASHFSSDKHTALICFQVLKAAIAQIVSYEQKEIRNG